LSVRTDLYRKLEHGAARWRPDVLDEAARMLGGGPLRPVLYRLALGARPHPANGQPADAAPYRQIVTDWPAPAVLIDDAGIVTCLNGHARAWFAPLRVGTPLAAAVLRDPAARELLADWPRWAALAAADLRYSAARRVSGRAGRLVTWAIRRVLDDPQAARVWQETSGSYALDSAEVLSVRSGPGSGLTLRVLVSEPGGYPGRIIRVVADSDGLTGCP
jgi:hypothetical protein